MDVIRHHHETMKIVVEQVTVTYGFDHQGGNFGSPEVRRADTRIGQKTIHGQDYSARVRFGHVE